MLDHLAGIPAEGGSPRHGARSKHSSLIPFYRAYTWHFYLLIRGVSSRMGPSQSSWDIWCLDTCPPVQVARRHRLPVLRSFLPGHARSHQRCI